jgi:hypothetical protein
MRLKEPSHDDRFARSLLHWKSRDSFLHRIHSSTPLYDWATIHP